MAKRIQNLLNDYFCIVTKGETALGRLRKGKVYRQLPGEDIELVGGTDNTSIFRNIIESFYKTFDNAGYDIGSPVEIDGYTHYVVDVGQPDETGKVVCLVAR